MRENDGENDGTNDWGDDDTDGGGDGDEGDGGDGDRGNDAVIGFLLSSSDSFLVILGLAEDLYC